MKNKTSITHKARHIFYAMDKQYDALPKCFQERIDKFRANNDLLPCSGGHPEWHLQQDVTELLKQKWDMIVAFPPCTYLTVTGNRW